MKEQNNKVISENDNGQLIFYCPACKFSHAFDSRWTFNGDFEKPTFSPSLLVKYPWGDPPKNMVCHSFITEGKISYLDDCTHEFAGKTIDMEGI